MSLTPCLSITGKKHKSLSYCFKVREHSVVWRGAITFSNSTEVYKKPPLSAKVDCGTFLLLRDTPFVLTLQVLSLSSFLLPTLPLSPKGASPFPPSSSTWLRTQQPWLLKTGSEPSCLSGNTILKPNAVYKNETKQLSHLQHELQPQHFGILISVMLLATIWFLCRIKGAILVKLMQRQASLKTWGITRKPGRAAHHSSPRWSLTTVLIFFFPSVALRRHLLSAGSKLSTWPLRGTGFVRPSSALKYRERLFIFG